MGIYEIFQMCGRVDIGRANDYRVKKKITLFHIHITDSLGSIMIVSRVYIKQQTIKTLDTEHDSKQIVSCTTTVYS